MTTHEAVSLVLQAFDIGNHRDTLVLDMGSPARIFDLARTLIRLSGKSEQEVDIRFTGLRDGEKLSEELSYPSEKIHPTSSPKIRRVRGTPGRWLDLYNHLDRLRESLSADDPGVIRARMKEIVPEFSIFSTDSPKNTKVKFHTSVTVTTPKFSPSLALD